MSGRAALSTVYGILARDGWSPGHQDALDGLDEWLGVASPETLQRRADETVEALLLAGGEVV